MPSPDRTTVSRAGGAPGLTGASSLSRTPLTTRMVAVAWAVADDIGAGEGTEDSVKVVAKAAAASRIMTMA